MPQTRTTVPGASTLGVTAQDVEAARRERDRLVAAHEEAQTKAHDRLVEIKEAAGGTLPATAEVREEVKELFAPADKLGAEVDAARDHLADLQARAYGRDPDDKMQATEAARRGGAPSRVVSLVERLVASEDYQAALENGTLAGTQLGLQLASREETLAILAPGSPMAATGLLPVVGDDMSRLFPPVGIPTQAPRFLDLISVTATDKDVVVYGVQTDESGNVTGAAAGTAFGSTTITTERREESIKRRGTLMDVFEDVLNDEPRMRTWLGPRLERLVRLNTEINALFGDGAGQNYTGLTNWSGIGTRQRALGQSEADAIHEAMTDVRIAYHDEPDAVGFRPETWHSLVTERSSGDGHYVNTGGPFGATPTSVWGKQAYTSTVFRDGTGSAGADPLDCLIGYHPEAELAVREGITLREFEQNKDNAEKGIVTLRVQHRSAFIVNQPLAFVLLDLEEAAA